MNNEDIGKAAVKTKRKRSQTSRGEGRSISLDAIRHEHIGRLLLIGSRIFERIAIAELRRMGFADLRLVHLALIRSLPVEGMRTTEIGELAGMTKQAVGQLAIELEKAGYVLRLPDPTDGRAKLVKFAERGQTLVTAIPHVLMHSESKLEEMIGSSEFLVLRRGLKKLAKLRNAEDDEIPK